MTYSYNLQNPDVVEALVRFTEAGCSNACPFCIGRKTTDLRIGEEIVILDGSRAGQTATVCKDCDSDRFTVKFQSNNSSEYIINIKYDRYVRTPIYTPDWLCQLATDDLCAIDETLLYLAVRKVEQNAIALDLKPIVDLCWRRRLPISGAEIGITLNKHGVNIDSRSMDEFELGIQQLVYSCGRPMIKRKKMPPMSKGSYRTEAQRVIYDRNHGASENLTS